MGFANLAPGNTLQNISNLLKPALLIGFLAAIRRAERSPDAEARTPAFDAWRGPRVQAAGLMTCSVATGFGVGFGIERPGIGTFLGLLVGAGLAAFIIYSSFDRDADVPDVTRGRRAFAGAEVHAVFRC